jgi:regulatory protein
MIESTRTAHEYALRLLEARRRTRRELERALAERRFDVAEVSAALDRLERAGLVDDAEFARAFLRERMSRRAVGVRTIRAKLLARGVAAAVADEAITELTASLPEGPAVGGVASEVERARAALRQVERRYAALEPRERRRRLSAVLARRGFEWETIEQVLRTS